ncbi:MAG: menaquinone-dependent protoporphyrinogen IX dehydrogenase [Methylococcales bacterium]|nr:menaquinone-dependent protoporphyrinogen IX dehydrogenase [Methylococcaceae bacterium]
MANILIIYSSTDGQTQKICHRLQTHIEQQLHQVTVVSIDDVHQLDVASFDNIVIGASIRYGHHSPQIVAFINKNIALLDSKPNAFFSVNVVARKPEKSRPDSNPYLKKFLKRIAWKPKKLAVFAGKLDYPSYTVFDRSIIRMIMWITKGPTDPQTVIEFTDWHQVELFAQRISQMNA